MEGPVDTDVALACGEVAVEVHDELVSETAELGFDVPAYEVVASEIEGLGVELDIDLLTRWHCLVGSEGSDGSDQASKY